MCFGNEETGRSTQTYAANPAVANAATSNLSFVQGLQNKGFQGYGGQQVADFSPQQQSSFDMTNATAGDGTGAKAGGMIDNYAQAGPQSVNASTISSAMSPYMNQYVMRALAPQMQQMDMQDAKTRAATNATATGSGAFGDARTGIEQSNNQFLSNVAREGMIGNAYNSAFNTAIGAGAQDVSNNMAAQGQNANFMEQYLGRSLGGAQALQGLQNQQLSVAGAQNQMGQQQTAQNQANLTAQYNQWLMAQQYPFQTAQLMNQTMGAGGTALGGTTTKVEEKPNNAGLSMLGSLAGSAFAFSDRRLKTDIDVVGALMDETPVYSYRYIDDPEEVRRIGLMAQDVEEDTPEAVIEHPSGFKMVDYGRATERSRIMAMAI